MEFNGWNSLEDLVRACGYTINTSSTNSTSKKQNNNSSTTSSNIGCGDLPNGFQSLNPELFIIIGEILGNIVAGNTPFNVQNAVGNWLQLVGQAILTYNAQQQYFQGGPGRYFNPIYYNVNNPFCNTSSTSSTQNSTDNNSQNSSKNKKTDSNSNNNKSSNKDKITKLELHINQLITEIEEIKSQLEK